jgi:hypothetical protein
MTAVDLQQVEKAISFVFSAFSPPTDNPHEHFTLAGKITRLMLFKVQGSLFKVPSSPPTPWTLPLNFP